MFSSRVLYLLLDAAYVLREAQVSISSQEWACRCPSLLYGLHDLHGSPSFLLHGLVPCNNDVFSLCQHLL